jgi:hypothetical protein
MNRRRAAAITDSIESVVRIVTDARPSHASLRPVEGVGAPRDGSSSTMLGLRKDETLVHLADRVVIATVTRVPVPQGLGRMIIEVEFQIERAIKGRPGTGELKIPVPYYVSPAAILTSFNFPPFSPGERYAIFLSRRNVPLEFVHLRGLAVSTVASIDDVTELRPLLPPARAGQRDTAFGRVPVSIVCAADPPTVQARHEAHLTLEHLPDHFDEREVLDELGASAAVWNGIGNVVVFVGPHGRFPVSFTRELPLHGAGLAVTDWVLDRQGTVIDARITLYLSNEAGPIPWSMEPKPGHFDLRSTLAHEIGHLLGLKHSSTIGDLMEGSAARKGARRVMTENDRTRLRDVYPFGAGVPRRVIEQAGRQLLELAGGILTGSAADSSRR